MDISYEKLSPDMYVSRAVPFIVQRATLCDYSAPWLHWHESIEFLRCDSGEGEMFMDGNRYCFNEGDIMIVNSGIPHFIHTVSKKAMFYRYIIIDPSFFRENGIILEKTVFSSHIHDKRAAQLFDTAFDACESDSQFSVLAARTTAQDLILHLCRCHLADSEEPHSSPQHITEIKKTVNYIRSNYSSELTLDTAADIAGFSVCYFSRKFKKVTGQTFITFLNTVRCENAAELLRHGRKVADVCYECGFSDPSYFSRVFKNIMGYAPSEAVKHK